MLNNKILFTFLMGFMVIPSCPVLAMEPSASNNKTIVEMESKLAQAAKTNNLALFQQLARNYSGPLAGIISNSQNLLHIAAAHNASDIVKYLVETLYFDVEKVDAKDNAAIDLAKSNGHIALVDYLALMREKQTKKRTTQEEEAEFETLCEQFAQETNYVSNCTICLEDKANSNFCKLPCGHEYCTQCLNTQLDVAINGKSSSSLCCPACKSIFDTIALATITKDKTKLEKIDEIKLQEWTAQQPNAKHCPTPECKYAFINESKDQFITHCPRCQQDFCGKCATKHAMNISCENAKNDTASDQWKKQNTKACPQCGVAIEKNEGCLHMTCKQCKHEFCWKCMQPYKEKGHGPFNCTLAPANNTPAVAAQAEAQDPRRARQQQIEEEYLDAERRRRDEISRRINPWINLYQDNNAAQRLLRDIEEQEAVARELANLTPASSQFTLERLAHSRQQLEGLRREAANNAPAIAAQPAAPHVENRLGQVVARRENTNLAHYNPQHERAHIEFAQNPRRYIHTILQNTDFATRFLLLTPEQRTTWVTRISEKTTLAFTSPARLALIWLEELERIEQTNGTPRRAHYAFISDNPGGFIFPAGIDPDYVIEFTGNNYTFIWNFSNFIEPFFPQLDGSIYANVTIISWMGGRQSIAIHNTTMNQEQVQAIINQANAHFAQQAQS